MSENHLRSHFWPFQINKKLQFLTKWLPSAILDVRNSLSIAFLAILDQYGIFYFFFKLQNGRRRPFWMSEIHFRSHFWTFQINTILKFLTKWLPSAILDVRNSLSIAFLAILDNTEFCFEFFYKVATGGHHGCSKITFDCISGHFRSIGHFGCLKFTFDSNYGHFRSIQNFFFCWPFWMSENHFQSHFWPFQIDRPFRMSEIHFQWHF